MHLTIHNIIYASEFVSLFIAGCIINQKQLTTLTTKTPLQLAEKPKSQKTNP